MHSDCLQLQRCVPSTTCRKDLQVSPRKSRPSLVPLHLEAVLVVGAGDDKDVGSEGGQQVEAGMQGAVDAARQHHAAAIAVNLQQLGRALWVEGVGVGENPRQRRGIRPSGRQWRFPVNQVQDTSGLQTTRESS